MTYTWRQGCDITIWVFHRTSECDLLMSTFSPVWEVVADDAEAVDTGVGGQDAVAALPFDLAVGLLLRRGSDWWTPLPLAAKRLMRLFVKDVDDGENEGWGCSGGVGAGMAAVVAMQCVGRRGAGRR